MRELSHLIDRSVSNRGWADQSAVLIRIRLAQADDLELGMRDLDGHPAHELLGFDAPLDWAAIGISQLGRARQIDAAGASGPGQRLRVTTMLSRTGAEATVLRFRDDDTTREVDEPSQGLVSDTLHRCLALPTPRPDVPVDAFFARIWLDAISAHTPDGDTLDWPAAARLHPAMTEATDNGLDRRANQMARAIGWDGVRWQTVEGRWRPGRLTPVAAAWFDDGSFARWVQPDPAELAGLCKRFTPGATASLVRRLVNWGVWPAAV
ncbi:MAG: hypothetical protein ACR2H3_02145 [Acidimicrobiales bacterium]